MDIKSIDWQNVWKEKRKENPKRKHDNSYWNKRAPVFSANAPSTGYAVDFIKIIDPGHDQTVLDMGCGSGTLALPMAPLVREITAVDFSDRMISILNESIKKENINNIKTITAAWEDDWDKAGIGTYDIAIASRSLSVNNLKEAIIKLNGAARERIYISTPAAEGPRERNIIEAVGREYSANTEYIYIYNLLYQMDMHANISFITEKYSTEFKDLESAVDSYAWMLDDMTAAEKEKLGDYLNSHLKREGDKWKIDYKRGMKWAVIWWEKAAISS